DAPGWLLAVTLGGGAAPGQSAGFLGSGEYLAYRVLSRSLLVGARLGGFAEPNLFGSERLAFLGDLGPVVGAYLPVGRLSATASTGPVLTLIELPGTDVEPNDMSLTAGLAIDGSVSFRVAGPVAIGLHGAANLNREMPTVAGMLRLEVIAR